jgi:hypothetical protein
MAERLFSPRADVPGGGRRVREQKAADFNKLALECIQAAAGAGEQRWWR